MNKYFKFLIIYQEVFIRTLGIAVSKTDEISDPTELTARDVLWWQYGGQQNQGTYKGAMRAVKKSKSKTSDQR